MSTTVGSFCKSLIAAVLSVGVAGVAVASPVSWPADATWQPVTVGGNVYADYNKDNAGDFFDTPPQEPLDIVGGVDANSNTHAGAYWHADATHIMFRLRLTDKPASYVDGGALSGEYVWTAMINTDADADVEWGLQLDLSGDNQVELVQALSGGAYASGNPLKFWEITLAGTPHTGVDLTHARLVNASAIDGSAFPDPGPDNDDYFVDFAFDLSTFYSMTGLGPTSPFTVAFTTSASHTVDNKDRPDYQGFSDPITIVPLPATAWMGLAGVAAVVVANRLGRRRANA